MPKISVCLPTFNGSKYLTEAIDSVLSQSVQDLELVIGDDGSSDETRQIIEGYAGRDPRINYVFNPQNIGYLRNTNAILKRCTGQYIKTFAQDDAFEPGCFVRLLEILETQPGIQLACVSRRHVNENGVGDHIQHKFDATGVYPGKDVIKLYLKEFLNRTGNPSQMFFRRQERVNSFNAAYYHSADTDFGLRLLEGGDYYYIAEPLLRYRVHKETTTITTLEDMSFAPDHVRLVDRFGSYLLAEGVDKDEIWESAIKGLVNKMANAMLVRGIKYDDFPTPAHWGEKNVLDDFENDEPQTFRRLACHLIKYVTERHFDFEKLEQSLGDSERAQQAVLAHNKQLIGRIADLEVEKQKYSDELAEIQRAKEALSAHIQALKSSSSWRLTAPLRKVGRSLSGAP
ncbi:MAG: glycosyltransferase [Candidatus Obscuribacterales bacterium]|nr:glycosyltransferase [Candidatus Obscuribacterales bacterium]